MVCRSVESQQGCDGFNFLHNTGIDLYFFFLAKQQCFIIIIPTLRNTIRDCNFFFYGRGSTCTPISAVSCLSSLIYFVIQKSGFGRDALVPLIYLQINLNLLLWIPFNTFSTFRHPRFTLHLWSTKFLSTVNLYHFKSRPSIYTALYFIPSTACPRSRMPSHRCL